MLIFVGAIQIRIVDQTFPADDSPRFFEINSHDAEELIANLVSQFGQLAGIINRSGRVVDGTGPNDHQQTWIPAIEDLFDRVSRASDERSIPIAVRQFFFEPRRRDERMRFSDSQVVGLHVESELRSGAASLPPPPCALPAGR